jgi:LDH2 family malate/lactate/ureidoglycolate dehydrogenase
MLVNHDDEVAVLAACLQATAAREDVATAAAEQMAEADLRGYGSHGALRLPLLVEALRTDVANGSPHHKIVRQTAASALIDGDRGLGGYLGSIAMAAAVERATATGVGLVGLRNAHYSGLLAYFARHATDRGQVALITGTNPPMVHPWGGREPVLGTTPLCVAVPANPHPIVLDIAMSRASRGKLMRAVERGSSIPPGWALDRNGHPTSDPEAGLVGALTPFGDHKGAGLALVLTLLAGPLLGVRPATTPDPAVFRTGTTERADLFLAIHPEAFGPRDEFLAAVEQVTGAVRSSAPAEGFDRARVPGDRAYEERAARLRDGVEIDDPVWEKVAAIAHRAGLDLPEMIA